QALPLLAWLNSRYVRLLIDATAGSAEETRTGGVPSRSYEVGIISLLPDPTSIHTELREHLAALARVAARGGAEADELDETTRRFVTPAVLHSNGDSLRERACKTVRLGLRRALAVIEAHDEVDRILGGVLDPGDSAEDALYEADGPLVTGLPAGPVD